MVLISSKFIFQFLAGQECCDLCLANDPNVKWLHFIRSGESGHPKCVCFNSETEPNDTVSAKYDRGSCTASPGRKKRQSSENIFRNSTVLTRVKKQVESEESYLETAMKSYGSQLRYECGLARKFFDPDTELEYTGWF